MMRGYAYTATLNVLNNLLGKNPTFPSNSYLNKKIFRSQAISWDNTHPAGDYSLQKFNLNPVAKGLEPHIENPPETIGDNFHEILLKKQPWRPEGLSIKKQENHVTPSSYTSDPSHGITSLDRETPLQETDLLKPKNSMFDPVKTMTGQIGDSNSYLQRKDSIRVFGKDIEILPGNKINGEQGRSPIKSGLADAQKSADPNAQESPDSFKLMGKKIRIPSPSAQNINREIKSHLTIPSVEGDLGSAKTILPNQEFRSPQNPKSPIISQPTHPLVPEAFPPGSTVGKEKNPAMDNGKSRVQNDQKTSVPQHGTQAGRPPNPEEFTEDIFNSFRNSKHASKSNELPPRKRKARMNSVIQSNVVKPTEFSKAELEAAEGLEKLTSGIQLGPQPGTKIKEPIGVSKAEENFDVAPSTSSQHFSKDNYKNPVTFENDPLHSNFDTMQSEKATNIKSNVITQHKEKIPHGEAHEESPNLNNGVGDLENLSWSSKRLRSLPTHQMEEGNNNVLAKLYNIKMSSNNIRDLDRPLKYYLKVKQDGAEASASSKLSIKEKNNLLKQKYQRKIKKINSMPSTPEEYGQSRKSPILID
ncbi:hypothetical protein BY996DRAFT_7062855 [Phakopsora pachyrhizi]|nr:hypothetical protein BY996DRAFT_7062855 [Phakopsora pachyrhizi]